MYFFFLYLGLSKSTKIILQAHEAEPRILKSSWKSSGAQGIINGISIVHGHYLMANNHALFMYLEGNWLLTKKA